MNKKIVSIDMRMVHASGIGTYISNLVPIVIDNMNDTTFNLLGNMNQLIEYNKFPNVKIIECKSRIYSIKEQFELVHKIPRNTDLLWSPHYNIPILYRGKLLVTVHDALHLARQEFVHGIIKRIYAKVVFNLVKQRANAILTVSNFSRSELIKFLNCEKRKIFVTYLGVDSSWYKVVNKKMNDNRPYILYVGNVKPHKNIEKVIRAFKLIENKIPHDFVIVGKLKGFLTGDKELSKYAQEAIDKRIKFTGFVSNNVLKQYVNNADLFVFPSLYEGFGLPPLEAMACGTPVAVSNIPPLREVCGETAIFFDPNDEEDIARSIYNLIIDSEKRHILSEKGIKRARSFKWEECADSTMKVIKKIINEEDK